MNRDTAIARWYRRVDPRCFTPATSSTPNLAASQLLEGVEPAPRGRWVPAFTDTNAAEEWRPLAEERQRGAA